MKLITAVIKPYKLDEVREALSEVKMVSQASLLLMLRVSEDKRVIPNCTEVLNTS